MNFREIMDEYENGNSKPLERWADRRYALDKFSIYRVASYLAMAVRSTIENLKGDCGQSFPNFNRKHDMLWTLRYAWHQVLPNAWRPRGR